MSTDEQAGLGNGPVKVSLKGFKWRHDHRQPADKPMSRIPESLYTSEALVHLYKHHRSDLLKRGIRNQSLFEAYLQYCYSPKRTVGEQLPDVRRDKRERAAFAAAQAKELAGDEDEEEDDEAEGHYRADKEATSGAEEDSGSQYE